MRRPDLRLVDVDAALGRRFRARERQLRRKPGGFEQRAFALAVAAVLLVVCGVAWVFR